MTTIELSSVGVTTDGRRLVSGLDLTVRTGDVMGVVGASGSGKTTLLRVLAGLARPTEGRALFDGDATPTLGLVTMAMQSDPLYTHLDVAGNLAFPLGVAGHSASDQAERIDRTARRMGVRQLLDRRPGQLSGGERAAVSVGRALVGSRAQFVLLDEPLAKADTRRRAAFRRLLTKLHQERPELGIVIATNDQTDLVGLANVLVVMHEGTIAQTGSPARLYDRPCDLRVAGFLGSPPMNLFPAVVVRSEDRFAAVIGNDHVGLDPEAPEEIVPHELVGRPVMLGVRPEHLHRAEPGMPFARILHATVGWVENPTGVVLFGLGGVGSMAYATTAMRGSRVVTGDRLELTWAPERTRIFDAESGRAIPKSIIGSAD